MALAAAFDLDIDQMDVSDAFLYAEVDDDEVIFVACPPGFLVWKMLSTATRTLRDG